MKNYVSLYCWQEHRRQQQYKGKVLFLLRGNNGCADALTILRFELKFRGFWAVSFTAGEVVAVGREFHSR